jgi:transposase
LDSCTRNTSERVNKHNGQKLNEWSHGLITLQLHNKLERYGIKMVEVSEYYTSKKCPVCGVHNRPAGRNYTCGCGYAMHRDLVGAMNILNDNAKTNVSQYETKMYLRIA